MANSPQFEPQQSDLGGGGNGCSLDLTPDQEAAVKLVERLYNKAKKARERYDFKWIDYHRMFRGRQWSERRPSYRHSEVVNLIFEAIQSMIPIMTDSRPRITFLPEQPDDYKFAEILNKVLESDWDRNKWMTKLTEIIFDAHIYGTGCSSLEYDQEGNYGLGALNFRAEDPFSFYPDPAARDINAKESDWFVFGDALEVGKLKCLYPDFAEYIHSDLVDLRYNSRSIEGEDYFYSQINNMITRDVPSPREQDKALVLTLFIKPKDIVEDQEESQDPETGESKVEYVQRLKYPNGRKIIIVNKIPVIDEEIEYEDGKFPYSKFQNYINPREFWGISEVEQLESPQRVFNKLISFALDTLTLMGNPIWIVDTASGVDTSQLMNSPGLIIEKDGQGEVRREPGVELQPYVLQLIDRMEKWFNGVSGSQDVTRGINPTGVTANAAIENLQQAAQTRVRQKMRNLDDYLKDVGAQYVSRVLQYYTVPQVYRITGDDDAVEFFKFHVEHRDDGTGELQKIGVVRPFIQDVTGQYVESEVSQDYILKGNFDVHVNTGSALPFSKAEKEQRLLQYFDRQIIDAEELLKQVEYPNYQAVLARMDQKKAQAAAAGGQPPSPKAPG